MKAKKVGEKEVAKIAPAPSVYREGRPAFLWPNSVFHLTKVVELVSCVVPKKLRRIFNAEAKLRLPDLDRKVRRELVDNAKAVLVAKASVGEKALAEGLSRAFNMPAAHVLEYGIVRQATRELADEPVAENAVRKHVELGGTVAAAPKVFAELVMSGPAKPEVGLAALTAACFKLRGEFKAQLEAEAEAVVRKYVEGGGKFVPRAKELAELIMAKEKPLVDFYSIAAACYKLIPGYRDKMRREEDAGIDAILAGRMGHAGGKSGATIGDALKFQAEGRPDRRQERPRKDKGRRRGEDDEDGGRGGKPRKK